MINETMNTLYQRASNGKLKHWTVSVEGLEDGTYDIVTRHGYVDSKVKEDRRNVSKGKNIGRSNETTVYEQAILEAESAWNKKVERQGYVDDPEKVDEDRLPFPMLAHPFDKRKHNIEYPCYVQPKMDGNRMVSTMKEDGTIFLYTRKGVEYHGLEHIKEDLTKIMKPGDFLDGELYIHDPDISLQQIMKMVRRSNNLHEDHEKIQYWIYDTITDGTMEERLDRLDLMQNLYIETYFGEGVEPESHKLPLQFVSTYLAETEEDIHKFHGEYVQQGFEGAMIRNRHGLYKENHRSKDLQKLKNFQDDEFEIIGGVPGSGREANAVVFQCQTKEGKPFDVRPRGSIQQREEWLKEIDDLIGQALTVRFQDYSDDGIPLFPVGIAIRPDWDQ